MNQDSRTLLSLVAAGRMTSAEAERWLAAITEERRNRSQDRSETRWVLAALAATVLMHARPLLPGLSHITSFLLGRV